MVSVCAKKRLPVLRIVSAGSRCVGTRSGVPLQVVRQRGRDRAAQVVAAPAGGDFVERREQLVGVERCHQFQSRGFEVGQTFEIVRQVASHFEDADMVAFDLQ